MWIAYATELVGSSGNHPSRPPLATDGTRNESRLSRSFALPVGRPSSAVARLRRVEASSRAPSSGKFAGRGGELRHHPSPLPQERGLPFPPAGHRFASTPFLAHPSADRRHRPGAEPGQCRGASAPLGPHDRSAPVIPPSPGGEGRGEGGTFHRLATAPIYSHYYMGYGGSAQRQGEGGTCPPVRSRSGFLAIPCSIRVSSVAKILFPTHFPPS